MDWILERCGSYQCSIAMLGYLKLHSEKLVDSVWEPSIQHLQTWLQNEGRNTLDFHWSSCGSRAKDVQSSSMGGACATSTLEKFCTNIYKLCWDTLWIYLIIQFIPQDQLLFPLWTMEASMNELEWISESTCWLKFFPHPFSPCFKMLLVSL